MLGRGHHFSKASYWFSIPFFAGFSYYVGLSAKPVWRDWCRFFLYLNITNIFNMNIL